jgi:predicted unusual protein kinase regulating ubiquinone biosynthesis (AarF/ABC1/UbiB family)
MKRERELTELPRGLRRRALPAAKIAAKAGWRHMLRVAGRQPSQPDPAVALVSAADLVEDLGAFKGLFMKAGQLASFLPSRETDAALELLGRLQDSGVAFAHHEIARVVKAELGAAPEELFERFERRPIAVASIGQVHRAALDGRAVAVKVQYPGIERAIREDFAVLKPLVRLGTFGLPIDAKGLLAELRERVSEECDYRKEAGSQRLFAELLAPVPFASVPTVVPERSGRRVLTTEFVEGLDYRRFRATASQEARNRAGETIFRAGLESCFVRCVVNGDPQPGNYLFADDGSVTFLDFGCVQRVNPEVVDLWRGVVTALLDGDRAGFRRCQEGLGFAPNPRRFDWEHQWRLHLQIHGCFASRDPFRFTRRYMEEMYTGLFYKNPNAMRTGFPVHSLMLNRAAFGRLALLADLGAEARFGEMMREMLETRIRPAPWPPPEVGAPPPGRARPRREATA